MEGVYKGLMHKPHKSFCYDKAKNRQQKYFRVNTILVTLYKAFNDLVIVLWTTVGMLIDSLFERATIVLVPH